jgi:LemA protein
MKKFLAIIIVFFVLVLLFFFWVMRTYNFIVVKDQAVEGQWGQVETVYQRRYDLVPNLVASVQGAMAQEKEVFAKIADARTRYASAPTVTAKADAAYGLDSAISKLLVVMENYPELKSTETVKSLMNELEGTENRINVERKRYNDFVTEYNATIIKFPSKIVASWFGFVRRGYFKSVQGAENAPEVKL